MNKNFDDFLATITAEDYAEMSGIKDARSIPLVDIGNQLMVTSAIFSINLLRKYHEWLSN